MKYRFFSSFLLCALLLTGAALPLFSAAFPALAREGENSGTAATGTPSGTDASTADTPEAEPAAANAREETPFPAAVHGTAIVNGTGTANATAAEAAFRPPVNATEAEPPAVTSPLLGGPAAPGGGSRNATHSANSAVPQAGATTPRAAETGTTTAIPGAASSPSSGTGATPAPAAAPMLPGASLFHMIILSSNSTGAEPKEIEPAPARKLLEITDRYAYGVVRDATGQPDDALIAATVLAARKQWKQPLCQVAWYAEGKKNGQGVLAVGESSDGISVAVFRPKNTAEAVQLEKRLGFPTTPGELARAYLENEVIASDDFQGKPVVFESVIADIARGAFNQPYVFFPSEAGSFTGLTCYFPNKDPSLRKIRKGSVVTVRGTVKGFLMQDVIMENCDILSIVR